ncbi:MAG: alpha/beta fold hydrolase [Pseudomonadota bacterium]
MAKSSPSQLIGAARLTVEAVTGVTELVEAVHMNVLNKAIGTPAVRPVAGITSLVYRSVKGVTRLVGGGLDAALGKLAPLAGDTDWRGRSAMLAALNGVLGDRLAAGRNALAIPMVLKPRGPARPRIVVLVHGLCMNDEQWLRDGVDHGATLAQERGYAPVYLHYNTGRHVSTNGAEFARALQAMVDGWPVQVEEIVIVGHSMGGLVARSACHAGGKWLALVRKMVFLGTPHHGAPLERGGNWINIVADLNAYSAPFARLAKLRSAGITDLRYGSVLDADWVGRDRFERSEAPAVLPLPAKVRCYAVAGGSDALVPLASALGEHLAFSPINRAVIDGVGHMELLDAPGVTELLLAWL